MSGIPELCCPVCSAELTIEQLFAHAETRQAFGRLAVATIPLGARLLAYVGLFAPTKNRMSIARKVKLLEELLPDVERGAIERKGREWPAPRHAWSEAIEQMLDARDARKLKLPLTSHGYLYEIVVSMAEKVEATQERQAEQVRRERSVVGGAGGPVPASVAFVGLSATTGMPSTAATASGFSQPGSSPLVRRMQAAQRRANESTTDQEPQP